ncbi:MAG TPA: COR domain-containing protein, partial [Gemmata sp.]|nr:COR domain-containing protein [Gemmata sp.]
KVILVGHGEAGKTTLRKRLMGLDPDPRESQTHGIEIHDREFSCGSENILVHFWDFGGQEIMHATHQFFLSRRSLYILVLDGRKDEDADYWLKYIESFGGDSPILIALTKIDQNPGFEVNRKELKERYLGIQDFFRINSLNDADPEIARLAHSLLNYLAQVEMVRSTWPKSWFQVKQRLQKDDKPYLELSEFTGICISEKITEEIKQKTLIRYLNDLGVALHFEDERLNLLQVLNPRWATQAVYRIINDPGVATAHGLFTRARLPEILKKVKEGDFEYPREKHEYLIELMKKFELCYEYKLGQFLLPDLLDVQEPAFTFAKRDIVRFRYEYDFLPRSILPRFIVRMHADIDEGGELVWRTGVVLGERNGKARAVVRSNNNGRWIAIEVEGVARREYFAVIRDTFERIHDDFQKLVLKRKVPLYDNPAYAVDYDDLRYHEEEKQWKILIGELQKKYRVKDLLDGIEPPEARKAKGRSGGKQVILQPGAKYYEGDDMSEIYNTTIGDGSQNVKLIFGKNVNPVIADKIHSAFNRADEAEDKSEEVRAILKQLIQEVARIIEKLPADKGGELAEDLDTISTQATAKTPVKKYWELSKKGIIDAAEAVGAVGKTAIELSAKLGPLLGFA